ncbi:MAG: RidA family protein [Candidatus Rokubacteria bacterium]|nr:RidA family protein [Candidatus Rokubacteria bacterium]
MAKIEQFCAKSVYDPPTYAQGIKVTGGQTLLFISGQVAYDKKGGVTHKGDFQGQALKAMVEAGGGRLSSIVKLNTYLTDIRYRSDLIPIRAEFFGKRLPASTLITTPALAHPDWLIEVEAIAVI